MHAKENCGFTLVALSLFQRDLNEFSLKGANGFVEKNSFLNHLRHQCGQLLFHGDFLFS